MISINKTLMIQLIKYFYLLKMQIFDQHNLLNSFANEYDNGAFPLKPPQSNQ